MSKIFKVKYHRVLHSGNTDHKLYGEMSEYEFMLTKAWDHEEAERNTLRELEQEDEAELFSLEIISSEELLKTKESKFWNVPV